MTNVLLAQTFTAHAFIALALAAWCASALKHKVALATSMHQAFSAPLYQFFLLGSAFITCVLVAMCGFIPLEHARAASTATGGLVVWWLATLGAIVFSGLRIMAGSVKVASWCSSD